MSCQNVISSGIDLTGVGKPVQNTFTTYKGTLQRIHIRPNIALAEIQIGTPSAPTGLITFILKHPG
jgi:hypothetical protein